MRENWVSADFVANETLLPIWLQTPLTGLKTAKLLLKSCSDDLEKLAFRRAFADAKHLTDFLSAVTLTVSKSAGAE